MRNVFIPLLLILLIPSIGNAQRRIVYKKTKFKLESGVYKSTEKKIRNNTNKKTVVFSKIIKIPDAVTLRLIFDSFELGEFSNLQISSLSDNSTQIFDSESLVNWKGKSAIFNGNKVEVTLIKSHKDSLVFFSVNEILVGSTQSIAGTRSLCGNDERVPIDDARVARFPLSINNGTSCTAWLVNHGAILSAGHCIDNNGAINPFVDLIEFNVPPSLANGTPVAADADDQYPIDLNSIVWGAPNGLLGRDWAVFRCLPNANTGLLPHQAQGVFFRMTREIPNNNQDIRITGYGADDATANDTEQTDIGPYLGEHNKNGRFWHEYVVDTRGHNSGSPIIWEASNFTIGIHTNGGCNPPNDGNFGTSFEHDPLESALNNFLGNNTVYVDLLSLAPNETGSVLSPYNTISEGINATPTGGRLYITSGTYNNSGNLLINKSMTILPPATGAVIIKP